MTSDVLVVDIGGDLGALVVYAPTSLVGHEVEITGGPGHDHGHGGHTHPIHNVVRRRRVGAQEVCAAVFPDVVAGTYRPYVGGRALDRPFEVRGGAVTEIDWPA